MANSIALIAKYLKALDMVYKYASKTAILDAAPGDIRETDEANVIKIAKIALQGLGDYDRNTGYVSGDATLTWETHTFTQDRGRKFSIDTMDNIETATMAFGRLAGEFIRTKTCPEFDAYRMATYADGAGNSAAAALTTGANVLAAIDVGTAAMDNAEVPEEGRLLFISVAMYNLLKAAPTLYRHIGNGNDNTFTRDFDTFDNMRVVKMPSNRFYSAITQYDGSTEGEQAGGYIENGDTGQDIDFQIIHPSAVLQVAKHNVSKIISPETNQTADAWMYFFRAYHDAFVLDNKTDGIYLHTPA